MRSHIPARHRTAGAVGNSRGSVLRRLHVYQIFANPNHKRSFFMGYLVRCPTCPGTMSSNASSCPHCGETEFTRFLHGQWKVTCRDCGGKKGQYHESTPSRYRPGSDELMGGSPRGWVSCIRCGGTGIQTEYLRTEDARVKV